MLITAFPEFLDVTESSPCLLLPKEVAGLGAVLLNNVAGLGAVLLNMLPEVISVVGVVELE